MQLLFSGHPEGSKRDALVCPEGLKTSLVIGYIESRVAICIVIVLIHSIEYRSRLVAQVRRAAPTESNCRPVMHSVDCSLLSFLITLRLAASTEKRQTVETDSVALIRRSIILGKWSSPMMPRQ